jgi:hypothetical protein
MIVEVGKIVNLHLLWWEEEKRDMDKDITGSVWTIGLFYI